jgi:ferredoxin
VQEEEEEEEEEEEALKRLMAYKRSTCANLKRCAFKCYFSLIKYSIGKRS